MAVRTLGCCFLNEYLRDMGKIECHYHNENNDSLRADRSNSGDSASVTFGKLSTILGIYAFINQ